MLAQPEAQGVAIAAATFDGAGQTAGELTGTGIRNYLLDLGRKRRAPGALYGLGEAKDPPMRRTYIIPRVAALVLERGAALAALVERGIDEAYERARRRGARGRDGELAIEWC